MKSTTASRASYLDFASSQLHDRPIALVVHSSPTVRRALLVTLDLDGFDVRTVGDASEAVLRLSDEQPQVIIAESGQECEEVANLFSQLRSTAANRHIPLILFSISPAATPAREWSMSGVHHVPLKQGLDHFLDVLHETVNPRCAEA